MSEVLKMIPEQMQFYKRSRECSKMPQQGPVIRSEA